MDNIFYKLNDININGYYRIFIKTNDNEETNDVLIKFEDNKFYDAISDEQWTNDDIETIKLQMHLHNDNIPNCCYAKLIKPV
jgi:hypothetical protein